MTEEQKNRSERSSRGRSRGRKAAGSREIRRTGKNPLARLFLAAGFLAAAAGIIAVFYIWSGRNGSIGERKKEARESSASVEPQAFPDDSENRRAGRTDETEEKENGGKGEDGTREADEKTEVEALLSQMTLEEKTLQLFMITPEALTGVNEVYAAGERTKKAIESCPVGGIVYFRQNLKEPDQVTDMLTRTKKYFRDRIGIEPFLGIDEEGGQVSRISGREEFGISAFPDMRTVGAQGDPKRAYEIGSQIGTYLSEYGFNLDFAPVADVLTNPENTVVAKRAFGSDGASAAAFVGEEVKGLREQGIEAVLKHFPGHGGTLEDSHDGYAETLRTLEEMRTDEWVPFREGMEAGARLVMVGHISAPQVTGDETPAVFSKQMVTEYLRKELGFEGIIITDALNMGAVTASYDSAEAAVEALKAGNDMLLMPQDFKAAYEGVLAAVKNGELSETRIDESVRRILTVKQGMQ